MLRRRIREVDEKEEGMKYKTVRRGKSRERKVLKKGWRKQAVGGGG